MILAVRCFAADAPGDKAGGDPSTLDAKIVSDTIPTSMRINARVEVSVTAKNTGRVAWLNDNEIKLSAIDDSDPFGPGRVDLAFGETVPVGQEKVFNFVMMAPSVPGIYTSDWQMLRENICRFGQILLKKIEVTPPVPPGPVTEFTATPGDRQISLSWTNPSGTYFGGTMIRCKTTGYPTGIADGDLVTNRPAAAGKSDGYVHTNLTNGTMYYYRAFPHNDDSDSDTTDSITGSATPADADVWMSQTFDSYCNGNLGGQGNWTTMASDCQVQSAMARSGKALVIDSLAASDAVADRYAGFTIRAAGTPTVSFDVAQSSAGNSGKPFGAVVFYADDATEIARFNCVAGSWRLECGSGSPVVLSSSVTQNTWYNVRLAFDLAHRTISASINGESKAKNLRFKADSASNLASIGVASNIVPGLTEQKMYLDNLQGK